MTHDPSGDFDHPRLPSLAGSATLWRSTLGMAFTHPEQVSEWGMSRGRLALCERVPGLHLEDVSDAAARAQLASAPGHTARTADDISASAIALPSIVRAAPPTRSTCPAPSSTPSAPPGR